MNHDMFNLMLHWVEERELIRVRKESGAQYPWTVDSILAKYRFCNVRREDDRVTVWIDQHIRKPYADHPLLWLMLCVARQINWPPTLQRLIDSPDGWPADPRFVPLRMAMVLSDWEAAGNKTFTGAYIIAPSSVKGMSKREHVSLSTIGNLWESRNVIQPYFEWCGRSVKGAHALLSRYNGWGPFLAYQAVVDMVFTPILGKASDRRTWAAAGPGTIRGLNRLHGRPVDARLSQGEALRDLKILDVCLRDKTHIEFDFTDVPNICCEFDKYVRVKQSEGKPRALYVPGRGS